MRAAPLLLLLALACSGPGYRAPEDSEPVAGAIGDRNIATRVRIVLGEDPETAPYDTIRVACADGVVTLDGVVDRPAVRRRAEELARGCEGVRRVVVRIAISTGSSD